MDAHRFDLTLTLRDGYAFAVDFGPLDIPDLIVDEPSPLGTGAGPNPTRLLGTALASCLGASLLFCLRKARIEVGELRVLVSGTLVRNEQKHLRIGSIQVRLEPTVLADQRERMGRCLEVFQDFCVVTESVRHGIDVMVDVVPTVVEVEPDAA